MPLRIALNALNTATAGLKSTAHNIANAGTDGFKTAPQDTQVDTQSSAVAPEASDVDLAEQLLKMLEFAQKAEIQARVIRTASENAEFVTNMLTKR